MDDRLMELETQFAFHESTIASLNEVIADQQKQIDALRDQVNHLNEQFRNLADSVTRPEADEPPPPHY